ncbi:MAG: hypothetical protein ACE5OQ_09030 [Woeseia sp.]
MTEDEKIIEISKILTAWNPLGDGAAAVTDLNNYQTEAIDIMSAMELFGYSAKKAVSEVLQEAFLIDLDKKKLEHYSNRVKDILAR